MRELATALSPLPNRINVIGHADPTPIQGTNGPFADNWALSLARAASVAQGLVDGGCPRLPTVEGLGDGRFGDVAPTRPQAERFALARRVDVVIYPERAQ